MVIYFGCAVIFIVNPNENYLIDFNCSRWELCEAYLDEPQNEKYKDHSKHSKDKRGH